VAAQSRLISLDEAGTSVWLDYIRRKLVQSGELQRMVDEDGLRGMTSNPTIFGKSIAGSTDYDVQIRDLVEQGKEPLEIFQIISTDDIREACDVLRPIYDRLHRYDGYVSIEVSPGAANDTAQSLDEARHLWKLVGRPNVMIKIPGTEAGLPAIEQLIFEGVNVNITLLFDVDNYAEVAERYIRGLERRAAAGLPVDGIASVASFFVSRVDTAVDTLLQAEVDEATDEAEKRKIQDLMGKAAIANAKIAYERFREIFNTDRWAKLGNSGAMPSTPCRSRR
jgi:transaldolase